MFAKDINQLVYSDIVDLVVERKQNEGHNLDYKEKLNPNADRAKRDLIKDIPAFANSGGGFYIIGISDKKEIIGIESTFNSKPIVEWINQVLSSNIEPPIYYLDPALIPIPDTDKVIVVIQIPESLKKPHFTNEDNCYYVRTNDSSKPANHNQIRDMFEFSRNRTDEFNDFLKKRNLFDDTDINFGINPNSMKLNYFIDTPSLKQPKILFSIIPRFIQEEKEKIKVLEVKRWLENNYNNYPPLNGTLLLSPVMPEIKLDGMVFRDSTKVLLPFYFEILNNGFIEVGSKLFLSQMGNNNCAKLTSIIGYEIMLLTFLKRFYEFIDCQDEILFQISFINMKHFHLVDFHSHKSFSVYRKDFIFTGQNNFKILSKFHAKELDIDYIRTLVKSHSEKICRAFGSAEELGFGTDNNIDMRVFTGFSIE